MILTFGAHLDYLESDRLMTVLLPSFVRLEVKLWVLSSNYPPANAGDAGSVPESGRYPGEGNGNPLQYSCLGNCMDRGP